VNKIIFFFIIIFLSNCSLDTKSGIWTKDEDLQKNKLEKQKFFLEEEVYNKEFNTRYNLKIESYEINNINYNNTGMSDYNEDLKKISKFRFKKIDNFNNFEPDLVSNGSNFVFFDDKLNILKFDKNLKLIWKNNFYSKIEKKSKPLLSFALLDNSLIVTDTIGKIYAIDFITGKIIWIKKNVNPFNSQIKIHDNKIFVIDFNNIIRCFSLLDGEEIWNFPSENTFIKSQKRKSIAISKDDIVYFNNSIGDITALRADNGTLLWQVPTQSSLAYENAFNMEISDLVINEKDLFFSNNRNEFYSINLTNGIINWKQNINSNIKPIVINDLIFTISTEGLLFVLEKYSGNIIKITDLFDVFNLKKRKKMKPVGFVIGKKNLVVSTDTGRILLVEIVSGKTRSVLKIDNNKISQPFVFDKKVFFVKNDAVIRIN